MSRDPFVYVGAAGIALTFLRLAEADPAKKHGYLSLSAAYSKAALAAAASSRQRSGATFLCGYAGVAAVAAALASVIQDLKTRNEMISVIQGMAHEAAKDDSDELLYGRVGYIHTGLFANKFVAPDCVPEASLQALAKTVLHHGMRSGKPGLTYEWYGERYLGAAHGVAGIVYILLLVPGFCDATTGPILRAAVDSLLCARLSSGNFPAVEGDDSDELVHWCHGAPGFVFLFCLAYKVFGDKRYLQAAMDASEVVWQRGLLKKGPGLCHGIAGNGYCFLALHRTTSHPRYLYRAIQFALFSSSDTFRAQSRTPDHPWSLFEGDAGLACFVSDVIAALNGQQSLGFPGFEIL